MKQQAEIQKQWVNEQKSEKKHINNENEEEEK